MNRKSKKLIVLCMTILVAVISAVTFAATRFPFAKVCFDGIRLQRVDDTTQGFIDITLKNIDATGISFCLTYDQKYLVLSEADTNKPIKNPSPSGPITTNVFNIEHKYFIQNTIFPAGVFKDKPFPSGSSILTNLPIIGIADQDEAADYGHVIMNFLPEENASELCPDYIEEADIDDVPYRKIMADKKGDLKLGTLSFKIKDPVGFSKLSSDQLKDIIKIDSFSKMIKGDKEGSSSESKIGADEGIQMSYIKDDEDIGWYSDEKQHISTEFNIKLDLKKVEAQTDNITVSSYEAYTYGNEDDLFKLLNDRMSKILITYSDESQESAVFEWDKEKSTVSQAWDPKGGEYTISQPYDEDGEHIITVKVKVNPIKLIGFETKNDDLTYLLSQTEKMEDLNELSLPQKTRPILDTYIPNGGISELEIEWYSFENGNTGISDIPNEIKTTLGDYKFVGHLKTDSGEGFIPPATPEPLFPEKYGWLTTDNPLPKIEVYRHVVDTEDKLPKSLVVDSCSVDDNGHLIIEVSNSDGPTIPALTTFSIKMPGGELIDLADLESSGRYSAIIDSGKAKIELWADTDWSNPETEKEKKERKLAQLINLGNRAGSFSIASTEPGKVKGPYTDFAPNPRNNFYLRSNEEKTDESKKNYEFDYSGLNSAVFPVREGTSLPTTLTLPLLSDKIKTTYSGYDGTEYGNLSTFSVDSWRKTDPAASETAGSVVEVTGTLIDTSYTNYGSVSNVNYADTGFVQVTIKYYVIANDGVDSIAAIPDAVYDKRQVGYDYDKLQTKTFTVTNDGTTDIHGLTAVISLSNIDDREAFVMKKQLTTILKSGESTSMDISTKIGLPLKDNEDTEYRCTVFILSENSTSPLQSFTISFLVTKEPTYDIILESNDVAFGTAKTGDGAYTAHEGDLITIIAEPAVDCKFVDWIVESGGVTLSNLTSETATFLMPAANVKIRANFKETTLAKLRLEDLRVMNLEDSRDLHDEDWNIIAFNPATDTYYVEVPNDVNSVKLWFKLRSEGEGAALNVTNEHDLITDDILPVPYKDADDYYKSADINLYDSPTDNIVTLTISKPDEENDNASPSPAVSSPGPSASSEIVTVSRQYKVHIYKRKKSSELMSLNYGNSPFGLIMRDTLLTDDQKKEYKDKFIENGYKFVDGKTPEGGTKNLIYTDKAWVDLDLGITGNNYDLSDTALFVIGEDGFTDPGPNGKVVNSIGQEVTGISKKVRVNILTETLSKDGSSDDFVYIKPETIELSSTGKITELSSERIRPGCYEMIYYFTDFDGKVKEISKPLIILPELGDVNVLDKTDSTDSLRILNRFSKDIADSSNVPDYVDTEEMSIIKFDADGLLFRYRVCDVNNDGYVNAIDSNYIRAKDFNPYYKNLPEGGDS